MRVLPDRGVYCEWSCAACNGANISVAADHVSLQVLSVAFSLDGTRMVTSSKDGTWAVWNIAVRYKQQEDPKRLLSCMQEVTAPHLYSYVPIF